MKPVPETHATLLAQRHQMLRGERRAQLYPGGRGELPLPAHAPHIRRHKTRNGDVFHFDSHKIGPPHIERLSGEGRENEILGLGPVTKQQAMAGAKRGEAPVAVVERNQRGTEVRAAAGTHKTVARQAAFMQANKSPGHSIHVEHPAHTVALRVFGSLSPMRK